jgi:hypothetical protein
MVYQEQSLPVRESIATTHAEGIAAFARAGTWFTGEQRLAMLSEVRHAPACSLCHKRKAALSPYAQKGAHDVCTDLPDNIVEVIHRLKTDSGRMTRSWFTSMLESGLSGEQYVEIVGVVATSVILDSFAMALGVTQLEPGTLVAGEPDRTINKDVFDGGAWVPMLDLAQEATDTGLPSAPNILRAMGLVPSAIAHFFAVMRAHYSLSDLEFDISRSQTELIAARVSSLNQCFY